MIENLLEYLYAKTYQNWASFTKLLEKISWCSFLPHMVELALSYRLYTV